MVSISNQAVAGNAGFRDVVAPFLRESGLPFADVLRAEDIERAFGDRDALFAQDAIFSTPVVLWAFLAQVLRDGKGAACAQAVADITTYMHQTGGHAPSGDTGDYCRARAKLSVPALQELVRQCARRLDDEPPEDWLWHGRRAKLADGFTFTMQDTADNQQAFPQQRSQEPGVGFPIARACAVLSLGTAAIHGLAVGPYEGKQTGESALLREIMDCFEPGDVGVFDRYHCSFMTLALLKLRGVDSCARLHQCRKSDFRRGRKLGQSDRLITWVRPKCPSWMSRRQYEQIPETLTLRMIRFEVTEPGRRVETITVVTTLTDPEAYAAEDIAELFGYRWNAELDIRDIKQTLGLDHSQCKSPGMVKRELWVTLLGYNLIRQVIATAAAVHQKEPRHIGFTFACQTVLSSWMLLATGACRDAVGLAKLALAKIAANKVAHRPGRIEPRVLKRRRHRYPLMQRPRETLRKELAKT